MDNFDASRFGEIIPAALGSFVSLRWAPGSTWPERALNLLGGIGTAVYVAPAVFSYLYPQGSPAMRDAALFVTGMLGLSLVDALVKGIKDADLSVMVTDTLKGLLARIFGRKE